MRVTVGIPKENKRGEEEIILRIWIRDRLGNFRLVNFRLVNFRLVLHDRPALTTYEITDGKSLSTLI